MGTDRAARVALVLEASGVLDDGACLDGRDVVSLGGGLDADTCLVRCPDRDVVVKLNEHTLEAEAAALRAWQAHTPRVPEVLGAGTVPGSPAVKFLVVGAMVNDKGDVVETADDFLHRQPGRARDLGRALGEELHLLHQARSGDAFGNFADTPGAERTYGSWSSYLRDFFMQHVDYVRSLGVPDRRIERVRAFIEGGPPVDEARYLHGDVTIRNIAVQGSDPLRISLFDPNPLCGDPSWDIAPMTNNAEYGERRHRIDGETVETLTRDRELLDGFWETYPEPVSEPLLLAARLVQALLQGEHRENAPDDDRFDEHDVQVTRDLVRDLIDRMST